MRNFLIAVALLGVCLAFPGPLTPTVRFRAMRANNSFNVAESIQKFTFDLSEVLWEVPGNIVFSPLSITSLMTMLMSGSGGRTNLEFRTLLNYKNTSELTIHSGYKNLTQSLIQNNGNVTVNMATRLFLADRYIVQWDFTQIADLFYDTSVQTLDFRHKGIEAMNTINKWVERETQGKITELITVPFKRNTRFVATNTVYFNGAWEYPFDKMLTRNSTFNTGFENITVPMMSSLITVPYVDMIEVNAEMISLPYKGNEYDMFIIRPSGPVEDNTLINVELLLTPALLEKYINDMALSTRKIYLPRMRLQYKANLKPFLKELGADEMFRNVGDFSRLKADTDNSPLWIEELVHETVVEITETGTEAAAATSVSLNRIGTSLKFDVDRPCNFLIRHRKTGATLFWGRVMKPEIV